MTLGAANRLQARDGNNPPPTNNIFQEAVWSEDTGCVKIDPLSLSRYLQLDFHAKHV
jgi:hypothetical protein